MKSIDSVLWSHISKSLGSADAENICIQETVPIYHRIETHQINNLD